MASAPAFPAFPAVPAGELRGSDLAAVREQLGRDPTVPFTVTARCPGGHPLVIRNRPSTPDGQPFPTTYWLTCPGAVRAISRLEAESWIGRLNRRIEEDPAFAEEVARAHEEYAADRGDGEGGVGGTRRGVKCLHAHYANHLAGGRDPVGAWVAERVEPIHGEERPGRVAAVDLGTNSIRLLVAEPADGRLQDLARDMVITRIGKGVDATGRIDAEALDRTVAALERYCRRARALHAVGIRVAATSAVRDASNRVKLETAVRRIAGSQLEVLSGEREAELSYAGALRDLDVPGPFLVVDIGGGSTEFAAGAGPAHPDVAISTRMGSVRLTERHVRGNPPSREELEAIEWDARAIIDDIRPRIATHMPATLVAVAGTATTVQAIALGLDFHDPEAVHGGRLSLATARAVRDRLARMSIAERASLAVMPSGREDVIVAGATILCAVMEGLGFLEAVVSERDILDGLAIGMVESELGR